MSELNGPSSAEPPDDKKGESLPGENELTPVTEERGPVPAAEQSADAPRPDEVEILAEEPEPDEESSPVVTEQPPAPPVLVEEAVSFLAASSVPMNDVASPPQTPPGSEQPTTHSETEPSSTAEEGARPPAERFKRLCRWLNDANGLIGLASGLIGFAGLTLGLCGLWQVNKQLKQANVAQCLGVFDALSQLDKSYGYGFCSLSDDPDDDSRLTEVIEPVLRRAEECDPALSDQKRTSFYRHVQEDLHDKKPGCESMDKPGPESVWLRLHCLQRQVEDQNRPAKATDAAVWTELAGEFAVSVPKASQPIKGLLEDCAAISRAQAYRRLAAITGRPEATSYMMAAASAIRESDEVSIAHFIAGGLAEYKPLKSSERRAWVEKAELEKANRILENLLAQEDKEGAAIRQHILQESHRQLWFTNMGVVVDRMAQARSKSRKQEEGYLASVQRLESGLRKAKLKDAGDFLFAQRERMKDDWYRETVLGASVDCENGPAIHRLSDALALESMRVIYGWWTQAKPKGEEWKDLQEEKALWLNWWSPQNEITATLCGLAADSIDSAEAQKRFDYLLKEVPGSGGLCYSAKAKSELWTAGVAKLPWLQEETKKRCAS